MTIPRVASKLGKSSAEEAKSKTSRPNASVGPVHNRFVVGTSCIILDLQGNFHTMGNTISFNNVTQIVKTGGDPLLDENAFANTSTLTARLVSRAQQSCFYLLTPDSGPRARPPRLIKLLQYVRRQVPPVSQTRLRWWRFYRPVSAFSLSWSDGVGRLGGSSRTKRMESTGSRR